MRTYGLLPMLLLISALATAHGQAVIIITVVLRIMGRMCAAIWVIVVSAGTSLPSVLGVPLQAESSVSSGASGRSGTDPVLPDPKLTPSDVLEVSEADVCTPGYTRKGRHVPARVRQQVFAEYGITPKPRAYEMDHLISLELGGSNSLRNLFPESYFGLWNARVKDRLENRLHKLVCGHEMALVEAQQAIASDWVGTYRQIFGSEVPLKTGRGAR